MARIRLYDAPQRNSITRTQKSPAKMKETASKIAQNTGINTWYTHIPHTTRTHTNKTGEIGKIHENQNKILVLQRQQYARTNYSIENEKPLNLFLQSVCNKKWTGKYISWNIGSSGSWISTGHNGYDRSVGIGTTQTKKYQRFKWAPTVPTKYLLSHRSAHVVAFNKRKIFFKIVAYLLHIQQLLNASKLFIYIFISIFSS